VSKARPIFDSPAAKVLGVLREVARLRTAPLSAVAEALGLPAPTVHRIATELERLGCLQRAPGTRHLTVAPGLVEMSVDVLAARASWAGPQAILQRLAQDVGEMFSFGVQSGNDVLYVASAEPAQEFTLQFRAGRKAPLFCTSSGRVFLSALSDEEVSAYLNAAPLTAFTPFTVTDPDKVREEIRQTRRRGYAMTHHQYVLHVAGAAVPVARDDGTLYGALSVAAPDVRKDLKQLQALLPKLRTAAKNLGLCFSGQRGGGTRRPQPRRAQARVRPKRDR
jgi:DNA-binding IclR family transcriptional regulator